MASLFLNKVYNKKDVPYSGLDGIGPNGKISLITIMEVMVKCFR